MNKLQGRSVQVPDGNVEKALRKFKKKIQVSGLLEELRNREHYVKPTVKRKLKRAAAKNRWRKKLADQALPKKLY
jgi:small subunit ribosomal protein S21